MLSAQVKNISHVGAVSWVYLKKKKTPAVKFLDLIFRNNFFVFNFSKMCSRWKL